MVGGETAMDGAETEIDGGAETAIDGGDDIEIAGADTLIVGAEATEMLGIGLADGRGDESSEKLNVGMEGVGAWFVVLEGVSDMLIEGIGGACEFCLGEAL
jgi:hypothetical protein